MAQETNTALMLLAFKSARRWRRQVLSCEPDWGAIGAFLALLTGLLRAASLARGNGRGYGDLRQCFCGHERGGVDVYLRLGWGLRTGAL